MPRSWGSARWRESVRGGRRRGWEQNGWEDGDGGQEREAGRAFRSNKEASWGGP